MGAPQAIAAVPGIDLSNLKTNKERISQELMAAATKVGFFYVTGGDVEPVCREAVFRFSDGSSSRVSVCRAWHCAS